MNGVTALIKETSEPCYAFHMVRTQREDCDPEEVPFMFTIMSSVEILKTIMLAFFSCFIVFTRSSSTTLNKSVHSRHPFLVPDFWKNVSSL